MKLFLLLLVFLASVAAYSSVNCMQNGSLVYGYNQNNNTFSDYNTLVNLQNNTVRPLLKSITLCQDSTLTLVGFAATAQKLSSLNNTILS